MLSEITFILHFYETIKRIHCVLVDGFVLLEMISKLKLKGNLITMNFLNRWQTTFVFNHSTPKSKTLYGTLTRTLFSIITFYAFFKFHARNSLCKTKLIIHPDAISCRLSLLLYITILSIIAIVELVER